jgi:hypothetical protein
MMSVIKGWNREIPGNPTVSNLAVLNHDYIAQLIQSDNKVKKVNLANGETAIILDYWKPTSPEVVINPSGFNPEMPQAWEVHVWSETYYFYNQLAWITESKYIWINIPDLPCWEELLTLLEETWNTLSQYLGDNYKWCMDKDYWLASLWDTDNFIVWWQPGECNTLVFRKWYSKPLLNNSDESRWLSLRFILKEQ